MPVIIRRPYCTESHADFFVKNITVCKGDLVSAGNGVVGRPIRLDAGGSPDLDLPLTLEDVKRHCRLDVDDYQDDELIRGWMRSAFQKIESDTGVAGLTARYRIPIDAFPYGRLPMILPLWPIQTIDLVGYYTSSGVDTQLVAGSPGLAFILDANRPTQLALERTTDDWPSDLREFQPGYIEVTAGFTDAASYPDDLKQAARLLIAQSSLFREHAVSGPGVAVNSVLMDYDRWIEGWRLPSL